VVKSRLILICAAAALAVFALLCGCQKPEETRGPEVPAVTSPHSAQAPARTSGLEETPPAQRPDQATLTALPPVQAPTLSPGKPRSAEAPAKPAVQDIIAVTQFRSTEMANGVPPGWTLDRKCGTPAIKVEEVGSFCLHLMSDGESSFGIKRGSRVDVREYPFLNWRWKIARLPKGGDVRKSKTDDQALQIYVAFPATGWPEKLNTPIVGYIWDNEAPNGWTGRSPQLGADKLRYIVVRNKNDKTGEWYAEKRNIYQDYQRLFKDVKGGQPTGPTHGVEIYINSQHTRSSAEGYVCEVYFSKN